MVKGLKIFIGCLINWTKQGNICETRAGPNRPQTRRGIIFVDFKHIFVQSTHFRLGCFDQNCQKAQLRTETFHFSLFPGLYDISFRRCSLD